MLSVGFRSEGMSLCHCPRQFLTSPRWHRDLGHLEAIREIVFWQRPYSFNERSFLGRTRALGLILACAIKRSSKRTSPDKLPSIYQLLVAVDSLALLHGQINWSVTHLRLASTPALWSALAPNLRELSLSFNACVAVDTIPPSSTAFPRLEVMRISYAIRASVQGQDAQLSMLAQMYATPTMRTLTIILIHRDRDPETLPPSHYVEILLCSGYTFPRLCKLAIQFSCWPGWFTRDASFVEHTLSFIHRHSDTLRSLSMIQFPFLSEQLGKDSRMMSLHTECRVALSLSLRSLFLTPDCSLRQVVQLRDFIVSVALVDNLVVDIEDTITTIGSLLPRLRRLDVKIRPEDIKVRVLVAMARAMPRLASLQLRFSGSLSPQPERFFGPPLEACECTGTT